MTAPRVVFLCAAVFLSACGSKEPAPVADSAGAAKPAPAERDGVIVLNETGEEVREVYVVGFPDGVRLEGSPLASLKSGERASFPFPEKGVSKVSIQFIRKPDIRKEKTVMVLGGSVRMTLRADGSVGASMSP
ncbi:MAG: hypothetical protein HY923_09490 [Elusimicrobia bacterium]|nr:hypothetical protein [Elusimicrobiota bacterium]